MLGLPEDSSYLDAESDGELYRDVLADALGHALTEDASLALIGRYLDNHAARSKDPGPR